MAKNNTASFVQGRGAERRAKRRMAKAWAKRRHIATVCLAAITTICTVMFAIKVIPHWSNEAALRQEQASLPQLSPFDAKWLEVNPDYVGWIKIEGTNVDYPVVRGDDNEKYLTTTFRGQENILGAIFMDYRCTGENIPHMVIYGHQASDKDKKPLMFGGLAKFLDAEYLAEHPLIMYIENDNLAEFGIFSARVSDVHDPAYQLGFDTPEDFQIFLENNGAPSDAEQIITLSTCVGADNDRRMIVQGKLNRTVPIKTEQGEDGWKIIRPPE